MINRDILCNDVKTKNPNEERNTEKELIEGIYVFVSFDLTNSTIFKNRHKKIWPSFVSSFYESISYFFGLDTGTSEIKRNNVERNVSVIPFGKYTFEEYKKEIAKTNGFHLWKRQGDEVLLYHKIVSEEELYATIQFVDYQRKNIISETISRYFKKNFKQDEEVKEETILFKQYFNVKTTIWSGSCAYDSWHITSSKPNTIYIAETDRESAWHGSKYDFLGPDIDEGFRLCSCSEKGLMLVSPKLVYLLLLAFCNNHDRLNALNQNLKIVNYISLKGIWEQRPYPLILYCQCIGGKVDSIDTWKKQFEYDAFENSNLFKNIDEYGVNFFHEKKFSINRLGEIYDDIVRTDEMKSMLSILDKQKEFFKTNSCIKVKKQPVKFEYHISCLCRNSEGKYWITYHETHGWSFGCVQVTTTEYCEYIKEAYKDKYRLSINIDEKSPVLAQYTAKRSNEMGGTSILGTIILAELQEKQDDNDIKSELMEYKECKKIIDSKNEKKIINFDLALKKAEELMSCQNTKGVLG